MASARAVCCASDLAPLIDSVVGVLTSRVGPSGFWLLAAGTLGPSNPRGAVRGSFHVDCGCSPAVVL